MLNIIAQEIFKIAMSVNSVPTTHPCLKGKKCTKNVCSQMNYGICGFCPEFRYEEMLKSSLKSNQIRHIHTQIKSSANQIRWNNLNDLLNHTASNPTNLINNASQLFPGVFKIDLYVQGCLIEIKKIHKSVFNFLGKGTSNFLSNSNWGHAPIYVHSGNEYLTGKAEGELWLDIIRLLNCARNARATTHRRTFLAGFTSFQEIPSQFGDRVLHFLGMLQENIIKAQKQNHLFGFPYGFVFSQTRYAQKTGGQGQIDSFLPTGNFQIRGASNHDFRKGIFNYTSTSKQFCAYLFEII